jgi:hypothetical protein
LHPFRPFFLQKPTIISAFAIFGDINKAIEEFKEALRLNPKHTNALYNLSVMTKKWGTD